MIQIQLELSNKLHRQLFIVNLPINMKWEAAGTVSITIICRSEPNVRAGRRFLSKVAIAREKTEFKTVFGRVSKGKIGKFRPAVVF